MKETPLKYWNPNTFEFSTNDRLREQFSNKVHDKVGTDQSGKCVYTYNELGFRGDKLSKQGFKVMTIGCSHTEGIGVNDWETYSHIFCSFIDKSVNLNFGCGGRSNDYISRTLLTFFDIVCPDLVLIQYTYTHRREVYTENNYVEPFTPNKQWGFFKETEKGNEMHDSLVKIQNDNDDFINWYKNHLLIKNYLENKKCNWVWNGAFLFNQEIKESNRFDSMSRIIDKGADNMHSGPLTHKEYAYKLYKFILENFAEYIPEHLLNIKSKNLI